MHLALLFWRLSMQCDLAGFACQHKPTCMLCRDLGMRAWKAGGAHACLIKCFMPDHRHGCMRLGSAGAFKVPAMRAPDCHRSSQRSAVSGLGFFVSDFVAKATGSGDLYQQGWHEASADKAAAFDKWDKFQRAARRRFGLQSGEHVQWHIGAAVAQRFGKFRQRFPRPPSGIDTAPAGSLHACHHRCMTVVLRCKGRGGQHSKTQTCQKKGNRSFLLMTVCQLPGLLATIAHNLPKKSRKKALSLTQHLLDAMPCSNACNGSLQVHAPC